MRFAHKQIPVIAVAALLLIVLLSTGVPVDLFSMVPVKRSHRECAQGVINKGVVDPGSDLWGYLKIQDSECKI